MYSQVYLFSFLLTLVTGIMRGRVGERCGLSHSPSGMMRYGRAFLTHAQTRQRLLTGRKKWLPMQETLRTAERLRDGLFTTVPLSRK